MRSSAQLRVIFSVHQNQIQAKSLDLTDTGCRLETNQPVRLLLEIRDGDNPRLCPAQIVWAQKEPDGRTLFGVEFTH